MLRDQKLLRERRKEEGERKANRKGEEKRKKEGRKRKKKKERERVRLRFIIISLHLLVGRVASLNCLIASSTERYGPLRRFELFSSSIATKRLITDAISSNGDFFTSSSSPFDEPDSIPSSFDVSVSCSFSFSSFSAIVLFTCDVMYSLRWFQWSGWSVMTGSSLLTSCDHSSSDSRHVSSYSNSSSG